tara:strand:+ start:16 stop:231 length:216 start_codon:yes stop_codon:yes gene_type:complete
MYLGLAGGMIVSEFCDYDNGEGIVCNRQSEIVIKMEKYDLYLCKRCLYMVDINNVEDKACYLNHHERLENE